MGSQRVRYNLATEQQDEVRSANDLSFHFFQGWSLTFQLQANSKGKTHIPTGYFDKYE